MEELLTEALPSRGTRSPFRSKHRTAPRRKGSLLDHLLRLKWWVLGIGIVTAFAVFLQYGSYPVLYSSSVVFFVDAPAARDNSEPANADPISANIRRLFHVATSSEMLDHLVARYDLYAHYGIDGTEALHEERVHQKLNDRLKARFVDDNSLEIAIQDQDPAVAAAMANEVFREMEVLTRAQALSSLERKGAIYRAALDQIEARSKAQTAELLAIASEFETRAAPRKDSHDDPAYALNFQLAQTSAKLTAANEDILSTRRDLEFAAAMLREQSVPVLHLSRRAMQDINTRPLLRTVLAALSLALVAMGLAVAVLILLFQHGEELGDYFLGIHQAP